MALPPLTRITETLPLYSPLDPALDHDAMARPADLPAEESTAYERYCRHEDHDIGKLAVRAGQAPTTFVMRALTAREREIIRELTFGLRSPENDEETILAGSAYWGWCLRLGLVSVTGEGWEPMPCGRSRLYGFSVWDEALLDLLPPETLRYLGLAVHTLTMLPFGRGGASGS